MPSPKTIIFTDLDGTLLHPRSYSFEEAVPALGLIKERGIPLILCSSKTRAELELYRKRLHNTDPFVVENGGALFVPSGYFPFPSGKKYDEEYYVSVLGMPYQKIRTEFERLRKDLGTKVRGFGDMTKEEISQLTGLPLAEASLARQREFSEPFIFEEGTDSRYLKGIEERGLQWTQGRFFHIMGDHDKGKAIGLVKSWYRKKYGKLITIGLGDGLNDLPLLKEVDHPVLVQKKDGSYDSRIELPGLMKTKGVGPAGWNRAVLELLKE